MQRDRSAALPGRLIKLPIKAMKRDFQRSHPLVRLGLFTHAGRTFNSITQTPPLLTTLLIRRQFVSYFPQHMTLCSAIPDGNMKNHPSGRTDSDYNTLSEDISPRIHHRGYATVLLREIKGVPRKLSSGSRGGS